jgi:hypothetical protein
MLVALCFATRFLQAYFVNRRGVFGFGELT